MISEHPTADEIRAVFDATSGLSVGLEEELMLLDPTSYDLVPRATEVLSAVAGDERFRLELPAAQLEIVLPPGRSVSEVVDNLAAARRALADRTSGLVRLAAAGVHPFAAPEGELNGGERYEHTHAQYGALARRQLVFSLQVHVAVGGATRTLAVYNALRAYLPELAALAANAPFHAGRDTGLASVRPKIAEALPRQGVPPTLDSWEAYAEALRWGAAAGAVPEPRLWWWELRPHPSFGTLELRVPDAQSTVADAACVASVAHALVGWLVERHDAGEALPAAPTWRIEENRWSAARDGLEGELADLSSGEREPTRTRLQRLLSVLESTAERLGCGPQLVAARQLVEANGAVRQRRLAAESGLRMIPAWLAECYLDGTS